MGPARARDDETFNDKLKVPQNKLKAIGALFYDQAVNGAAVDFWFKF